MVQRDIRLDKKVDRRLSLPNDAYTVSSLANETNVNPKREQALEYYYKVIEQFGKKEPPQPSMPMGGAGKGSVGEGNANAPASRNNNNGRAPHQWEGQDC